MTSVRDHAGLRWTAPMRLAAIILSILCVSLWTRAARADVQSPDDLKKLFADGKYDEVVKGADDSLVPNGGVSEADARFKIASLKAESLLRLKQFDPAAAAFTAAARETQDAKESNLAKATAILIARSKDGIYVSKAFKPPPERTKPPSRTMTTRVLNTGSASAKPAPVALPPGQYDIIATEHRAAALAALWNDERVDVDKKIKEQIALKTLAAIKESLDVIGQTEPLAIATGHAEWAAAEKNILVTGTKVAVDATAKTMTDKVDVIAKAQTKRHMGQKPKPLPQSERTSLNEIIESCNKTIAAVKDLIDPLGAAPTAFKVQNDLLAKVQDRATTVLAQN